MLYLMEDMATGEIRLSILWEWFHKGATLAEDDPGTNTKDDNIFSNALYQTLMDEEYEKLLSAGNKDVHDASKTTTLPIARAIADTYLLSEVKPPSFIDLLTINLNNTDVALAKSRISSYMDLLEKEGTRISKNLVFIA